MVDKDVTISQLLLETDLLRSQVFGLEQTHARLQKEMAQLRADNQKLKEQIARLKRNSSTSSKPPSSDIVKPKNKGTARKKRKRKIGGQKGHPRQERIPSAPDDIDHTLAYELPLDQAQGLIPLEEWFVLQQVDLAEKLYVVTEHRARKYLDPRTGRTVVAPLPEAVKAAGAKLWTWCFRAPDFTVFHIDPSRSSDVLKAILTETFGGVIGSDYFSAYHKYMADCDVLLQFCWGRKLLPWVRKLFDTWHRAEQMTEAGFARSMDRIRRGFLKAVRRPPSRGEAQTLAARFCGRKADDYFRFLTTPGIEPTNNQTEQAIRHIVIDRLITQGTRSPRGQRWCERVWTVLATCRQQNRRVFEFFCDAINAHFQQETAPSLLR